MLELFAVPFLACLVLTAMHVHLGQHVLARGIIFVDLALAQLAALGMAVAMLAGHAAQSDAAYWYALSFALAGAVFFTLSRMRGAGVPHEAVIGIVYAASAAGALLVLDRAPQGAEHIKQLLVGSILTVTLRDVAVLALLYALLGALHWLARRPLLEISHDPEGARRRGRAIAGWDLMFYATFGLVVTSSVRVAGVLLVFSYLVVPATMSALLVHTLRARLLVGWAIGAAVSALGLWASGSWDLPTGAAVVSAFGVVFAGVGLLMGACRFFGYARANGRRAVADVGAAVGLAVALAGSLLSAFPRMDHHWLNWLESRAPSLELAFLDSSDVERWHEARQASDRGAAELQRLRSMQQDVQWGRRPMSEEKQEQLRQYLASRGEIVNGDRLVLSHLRSRARDRQRWQLGLPLAAIGGAGGLLSLLLRRRLRRRTGPEAASAAVNPAGSTSASSRVRPASNVIAAR